MTKTKSTKRALLTSVLALFLCFTMLLGTTFAWFTDSVTSANNIIKSGKLDVALEYKADWNDKWMPVDKNTKVFKEGALYEPGYTEVVYLRISNAGSLAFKYNLNVNIKGETGSTNVYGDTFMLSDYLQIGSYYQDEYVSGFNYADALMPHMFGTREAALKSVSLHKLSEADLMIVKNSPIKAGEDTAQIVALVLTMPESGSKEANTKPGEAAPKLNIGLSVAATQYADERDSFDNQYDKDSPYPEHIEIVGNEADFLNALKSGGKIKLSANISLVGDVTVVDKSATIDLNGYTLSSNRNYKNGNASTTATLHVKGASTKVVICGNGAVINNYKGNLEEVDLLKSSPNSYAIYVSDGADLTITGGTYKSFGSAVYVGKGSVNIQGGFFESDSSVEPDPWYKRTYDGVEYIQFLANVVNCSKSKYNAKECTVIISGGTFVNEDPTDLAEGDYLKLSHVAKGYKVVTEKQENGDKRYTVVAE